MLDNLSMRSVVEYGEAVPAGARHAYKTTPEAGVVVCRINNVPELVVVLEDMGIRPVRMNTFISMRGPQAVLKSLPKGIITDPFELKDALQDIADQLGVVLVPMERHKKGDILRKSRNLPNPISPR